MTAVLATDKLVSALLEFYTPLLLGILYGYGSRPSDKLIKGFSRVVLYSFLPLLLFSSVYNRSPGELVESFTYMVLSASLISSTSFIASYLLTGGDLELVLLSTYLNSGYLPIPLAYVLWGEEALPLVGFYILTNVTVGNVLAPFLLAGRGVKEGVKVLSKYPPLYAIATGVVLSYLGLRIPQSLLLSISHVGAAAPYIALFILGMEASRMSLIPTMDSLKVAVTRFVVAPLVTYLVAPLYIPSNNLAFRIALLESFMPPAITNVILANEYGSNPVRVAKIVLNLTLMATAYTPILLLLITGV